MMQDTLPGCFETTRDLDAFLSQPSESLIACVQALEGDIMVLGAGGKIGPTLTLMAQRAVTQSGTGKTVFAVDSRPLPEFDGTGIVSLQCDLLDREAVRTLPKAENVIFMVGRKFGSTGSEWLTWAVNVLIPHYIAEAFHGSRAVVFSTGCVYPVTSIYTGGSVEADPPNPIGEYAISSLGRERVFDYYAAEKGMRVLHFRLNYALELRYGVLVDIALQVYNGDPVDLTTGFLNGIWQGDCCDRALRSLAYATSPATILNVTGPELLSVRRVAQRFADHFGKPVTFAGEENGMGYLSNASQANALFGNPSVPVGRVIDWVADWVARGGETSGKPTHFETQNGKY